MKDGVGDKIELFQKFHEQAFNKFPDLSCSYTCSYHCWSLYPGGAETWRGAGLWMDASLSESQPSPAPMNEWLCSRTGQLACWGLLGWVMNIPPARGEGTVASTSQAQYWSCRSSSISDELGLWIFTLEILWSNDQKPTIGHESLEMSYNLPTARLAVVSTEGLHNSGG